MRNAKKHKDKFFIDPKKLPGVLGGEGLALELSCSRRDAKAMIDDLTDKEFEVLAALLGHLSMLNEKFPADEEVKKTKEDIRAFFAGGPKTVKGIFWKKEAGSLEAVPCLYFDDGTFFEIVNLVSIPGQLFFNWGKQAAIGEQQRAG